MSTAAFPRDDAADRELSRPGDVAERAERAIAASFHTHLADTDALRSAVCDYVAALRAAGAEPQQMLVAVKRLLERARPPGPGTHREEQRALEQQVIRWCIEEYYRAADAEPAA